MRLVINRDHRPSCPSRTHSSYDVPCVECREGDGLVGGPTHGPHMSLSRLTYISLDGRDLRNTQDPLSGGWSPSPYRGQGPSPRWVGDRRGGCVPLSKGAHEAQAPFQVKCHQPSYPSNLDFMCLFPIFKGPKGWLRGRREFVKSLFKNTFCRLWANSQARI